MKTLKDKTFSMDEMQRICEIVKIEGKQEIIDNLEEWAINIGQNTLITLRTVINTLKSKENKQ